MVGPRIGPSIVGTPVTLITRPIRLGPAVSARINWPTGMIRPPPTPCRTRKAIRLSVELASPHSAEPSVKRSSENR